MDENNNSSSNTAIILLEFNELCTSLVSRFIEEGKLPNFKRFRDHADVFTTLAEEEPPYLEPWIQWVNVHSGLTYAEHGIFRLGQGHHLKAKCIWDAVSDVGDTVWVCGSMNIRYELPINGYVLPDPWTTEVGPLPHELSPFFNFVRQNVLEHTTKRAAFTKADLARFLRFMCGHGLSVDTVQRIARQLSSELVAAHRWKRAFILDQLQFDVFKNIYRLAKPRFSTFFLNSTAHMQHMYWRNMEPQLFRRRPTEAEQAEYASAIELGYMNMDNILGKFLRLAAEGGVSLVLMSALSQQPCLKYEEQGGKVMYRPRKFVDFLSFVGVHGPYRVAPVMSEEFHVYFDDEVDATDAAERLSLVLVGNESAIKVRREGCDVFAGCKIFREIDPLSEMQSPSGLKASFDQLFYRAEGMKSGMHHREGFLWFHHGGRQRIHRQMVSLTSVAPMLLEWMGVPLPGQMAVRPPSTAVKVG